LRRDGWVPANLYGHHEECIALTLELKAFRKFLEAGHRVVNLEINGRSERGLVKEIQYDAYGDQCLHVDFARVGREEKITVGVPVETVGAPKGVSGGGVLVFPLRDLRVEGPADRIPERLEVHIAELHLGEAIRVRDLPLPEGCSFKEDLEQVVVMLSAPQVVPEAAPAPEAPAASEPEVIKRKKEEEESAEAEGGKG
jgi:large subunit ribosomal protein L25